MADSSAPVDLGDATAGSRRPALGYAMVVAAAMLWGVNGTVAKVVLDSGLSSYRLAEIRAAAATVVLVLVLVLSRRLGKLRARRSELPFLAVFGVLGLALVHFLFFVGIERIDVGVVLVLQYLAAVWVALAAWLFLREDLRRRFWLGLGLSLAGLVLVVELWGSSSLDPGGVLASIAGSFLYASYVLMAAWAIGRGRDVFSLLAWGFLFAAIFWSAAQPWGGFPFSLLDDRASLLGRLGDLHLPVWLLVGYVVLIGTIAPLALGIAALKHISPARVTLVATLEPVVGAVVAFGWLGQTLSATQIWGAVLVLVGVTLAQTAHRTGRVTPRGERQSEAER